MAGGNPRIPGQRRLPAATPRAALAAVRGLLVIALIAGCAFAGESQGLIPSDGPGVSPDAGATAIPSDRDGRTYDGELLGFTIADVEAIAADLGLVCTYGAPVGDASDFFCKTSTPEFDTPQWFIVTGHMWGDEAYNLSIVSSTGPPDEQASRDAAADIAETLMPWITDLGWYHSGDYYCGPGRHPVPQFDNFGPHYSICGSSSPDTGGDGLRSDAGLDIATEPDMNR